MQQQAVTQAEHDSLEHYLVSHLTHEQLSRPLLVSFTQWDFAVGALAEMTANLLDMGSDPLLALWSDQTPLRDVGWLTDHRISRLTASSTIDQNVRKGLLEVGLAPGSFLDPPLKKWKPAEPLTIPRVLNRSAMRQMTYRGSAMGRAILQVPPDKNTPVTDDHVWPERYVKAAAESYAYVFDQVVEVLQTRSVSSVIAYNGRFLHDNAVAAAAISQSLPVMYYDTGGLDTDFDLTVDETHDWSALQDRMKHMAQNWGEPAGTQIGSSWFTDRTAHTDVLNQAFTGGQKIGQGLTEPPAGEKVVLYFSSSGDEISELDLDWSKYFFGQPQALKTLANSCRELGYALVVRTHPHNKVKPDRDVQDWLDAVDQASPAVHVDHHSDLDSYALMNQADVVVTYGSTTGVEAAFQGKPVIVMGPSAYDELGCARRVTSQAELVGALKGPGTVDSHAAVSYGLMMRRRGFSYRYVQVGENGTRSIGGVALVEPRPIAKHLSHLKHRVHKRWLNKTSS